MKTTNQSSLQKKEKRILPYLYGGGIVLVFLLALYAVKGFFPFGDESMAVMDMCHGYIPIYYHLYDFLHGDKALFFDFYSGTGVNMVGIAAANGLLSPLNLLFYLTPRDSLVDFLNLLLLVKAVGMALSAQFFFLKRFPRLAVEYATAFSVLYALSGYVLLYYLHIIWLDVLILFPLLLYFCEKMLCGGKTYPYVICLALTLVCSFYLGIMTLLCLFFLSGAYVFVVLKKEQRPAASLRLGLGTLLGALMPMFLLLPGFLQMRSSARYGFSEDLSSLLGAESELNVYKIWMFYGLALAIVGVFLLLRGWKKHPQKGKFAALTLVFLFAPLVVEGSAALLHFGSYKDFPYRFGFIAVFMLLVLAAEAFSTEKAAQDEEGKPAKKPLVSYLLVVVGAACTIVVMVSAFRSFGKTVGSLSEEQTALLFFAALLCCSVLTFALLLQIYPLRLRRVLALVFCVLPLFPFALQTVGTGSPLRYERREHDVAYIEPSLEISKVLRADPLKLERVQNPDMSLNINYGFVMGRSALSNWTHQIPASLQNTARALGYSITYTLLLDGGGTVFSDALLHMTETVSKEPLDEALYEEIATIGDYHIYENRYTLPIGLLSGEALLDVNLTTNFSADSNAVFENQNAVYRALGGSGDLIRTLENDNTMLLTAERSGATTTYQLQVQGQEALYVTAPSLNWSSVEIAVNGETVTVPSYHREDNTAYTAEYNNNCLELGVFEDEIITVTVTELQSPNVDVAFGLLSLEKMDALSALHEADQTTLTAEGRTITVQYRNDSTESQYLFLPVAFDNGWRCRVGGEDAEILTVVESFMAVAVPAGTGEIVLTFVPEGLEIGSALTGLGTLGFLVLLIWEIKKKQWLFPSLLKKAVEVLFGALWLGGTALVYLLPLGYAIVNLFQ